MSRYDDDEDFDDDYPDEGVTIPCPNCGVDVYDDAEQCPHCGWYLSQETAGSRLPRWVFITAVICLIAFIYWAIRPLLMLR